MIDRIKDMERRYLARYYGSNNLGLMALGEDNVSPKS